MWRKPETDEPATERPASTPIAGGTPHSRGVVGGGERATIGPSIAIKGDVTGEEDLVIQGRVEGKIDLKQHNVTVGRNGRVKADIYGRVLTVEGEVEGNLYGDEKIIVQQSGKVNGNISAPRVAIEDGAQFKGSIDMDPRRAAGGGGERRPRSGAAPEAGPGSEPDKTPVRAPVQTPVQETLRASGEKA